MMLPSKKRYFCTGLLFPLCSLKQILARVVGIRKETYETYYGPSQLIKLVTWCKDVKLQVAVYEVDLMTRRSNDKFVMLI